MSAGDAALDIVVCAKKIPNVSQLMPDSETGAPQLDLVPYQLSDFDENAIEAAVQLKEKHGGTVTLLTASATDPRDVLSKGLAMGADGAVAVVDEAIGVLDSFGVSRVLSEAIKNLIQRYDVIICGEGSVDAYNCQVGPRLAEHFSIPCITHATRLEVRQGRLHAERVLERRTEKVSAGTPALITVGMETNKPRYVPLLKIMAASTRPIREVNLAELRLAPEILVGPLTLKVSAPKSLRKCLTLEGTPGEVCERLVAGLSEDGVIAL